MPNSDVISGVTSKCGHEKQKLCSARSLQTQTARKNLNISRLVVVWASRNKRAKLATHGVRILQSNLTNVE